MGHIKVDDYPPVTPVLTGDATGKQRFDRSNTWLFHGWFHVYLPGVIKCSIGKSVLHGSWDGKITKKYIEREAQFCIFPILVESFLIQCFNACIGWRNTDQRLIHPAVKSYGTSWLPVWHFSWGSMGLVSLYISHLDGECTTQPTKLLPEGEIQSQWHI